MIAAWASRVLVAAALAGVPPETPVRAPPSAEAYARAAAGIFDALASDAALRVQAALADIIIGPGALGYERPADALLQTISTSQTHIEVPGAADVLVAVRDFIQPHVDKACALESPFKGWLREARPDLVAAVDFTCALAGSPEQLVVDRLGRLTAFETIIASDDARSVESAMRAHQSVASAYLEGDSAAHAVMALAARAAGLPDVWLPAQRLLGFPTVGPYADSGMFRAKPRAAWQSMRDLDSPAHNTRQRDTIASQWRAADEGRRSALKVVCQKTYEEVEKGLMFGPYLPDDLDTLFGAGNWHSLNRFGVEQGVEPDGVTPTVRPCDNGRSSLTNACLELDETISCESASFPALVASLFTERGVDCALEHSTDDVVKAYRRMAACDAGTTVVALWDSREDGVRYFLMPGHNFGLVSAVLSWNRQSQLVACLARRYFGVPCAAYFDDYDVCEPSWATPSGKGVLRRLHEWLGIPLATNEKDVPPRPVNAFLGVITDLSRAVQGVVTMRSKPERVAKLILSAEKYWAAGPPSDELKHFLGKCEYLHTSAVAGRVGRAAIGMLKRWDHARKGRKLGPDEQEEWDEIAREALEFLVHILPRLPVRVFRFKAKQRKPVILYTDAMYETSTGEARIGIAIFDPEAAAEGRPPWRHVSATVPRWVFDCWRVREQYIGPLETIAPLIALLSAPEAFRDRDVVLFIDNTGALFGLGKGDCREADSARIIHLFHVAAAALRARVWVEHVATGANLADMPSRDDLSLLRRLGSVPVDRADVTWPDLSLGLTRAFHVVWDRLAGKESAADKKSRQAIERAIETMRRGQPATGRPSSNGRARARWAAR